MPDRYATRPPAPLVPAGADEPPACASGRPASSGRPGWSRTAARRAAWLGVLRSLAAVAAVVAFGLGWAGGERLLRGGARPPRDAAPYAPATMPPAPAPEGAEPPAAAEPELWLVDGFNVLHAGVLRGRDRADWWRVPAQLRLVERVARFEPLTARLCVVFDAAHERSERCAPPPSLARVEVVFAASADDWLVREARRAPEPGRLAVVTGDRQVAGRARHAGARVVSPRTFLARCAEPGYPAPDAPAESDPPPA